MQEAPQFSTKFVRTWRDKRRNGEDWKMRRARLVAREYKWLDASRDDAYAPTTFASMLKMLRIFFLSQVAEDNQTKMALCIADVKDAFLIVSQPTQVW